MASPIPTGPKDDVIRDYYVYLHKDPATGQPFYVGKGRKDRAYSKTRRHPQWHSKVEASGGKYEVEFVARDLLEREAFEFEANWIAKLGKVHESGCLVNWTDGGENELGNVGIEVDLPGSNETYEATHFVVIKGPQRKSLADAVVEAVDAASESLAVLYREKDKDADDYGSLLAIVLRPLRDDAEDFGKRKVSCKDMAYSIDEAVAYLEQSEESEFKVAGAFPAITRLLDNLLRLRTQIGERRAKPKPLTAEERQQMVKNLEEASATLKAFIDQRKKVSREKTSG